MKAKSRILIVRNNILLFQILEIFMSREAIERHSFRRTNRSIDGTVKHKPYITYPARSYDYCTQRDRTRMISIPCVSDSCYSIR